MATAQPVLTRRHRAGHPVQSSGHAALAQDAAGAWWATCLATRHDQFTPRHQMGRETFLAPVRWEDDWDGSPGRSRLLDCG